MGLAKEIGLDIVVAQSSGLVSAEMDGEKVMLNIENGKYFGLDSIGSRIWELIEKPHRAREVVEVLLTEYDVGEEKCQDEVLTFLSTLHDQGLVDFD